MPIEIGPGIEVGPGITIDSRTARILLSIWSTFHVMDKLDCIISVLSGAGHSHSTVVK